MNQIPRMADLDDFIQSLASGLEGLLDEGAANVSGGQRQRIGIARVLAQFPTLLVLDEATSSLDDFAQKRILSNFRSCDQLLLFDKGCLVADGSLFKVLARYRKPQLRERASQN